ncbi:MAG: SGNH/GDSL hydrolase family protein [Planctomycetes bacterium]|nr:SGNH/GDSL hydrolase family protein [Planctomycetota bacterium]
MSATSATSTRKRKPWVVTTLVVVGLLGLARSEHERLRSTMPVLAQGAFWGCVDAAGEPLAAGRAAALQLPRDARMLVDVAEDATTRFRTVRVDLQRAAETSALEIVVRERAEGALVIRVGAQADRGVLVHYRDGSGKQVEMARKDDVDLVGPTFRPFKTEVSFAGSMIRVAVNDVEAAAVKTQWAATGKVSIAARGGPLLLAGVRIDGNLEISPQAPDGGTFERRVEFDAAPGQPGSPLAPPAVLPALAREFAVYLAAVLLGALMLRGFCRGAPPLRAWPRVVALLLAPACAYFTLGFVIPVSPYSAITAVLFPIGFVSALNALGSAVRGDAVGPSGAWARVRPWLVAVPVLCGALHHFAAYAERFFSISVLMEQACAGHTPPPPHTQTEPLALGLDTAYSIEGKYRDFDLRCTLSLDPGAIGLIRMRASSTATHEGISLVVSADPRMQSGFVLEGRKEYERVGNEAGQVTAGTPHELSIRARGRTFVATLDGAEFATGEFRLYGEGAFVVMTHRGTGALAGLSVTTPSANEPAASIDADRLRAAVPALAFWLIYALLCVVCLRVAFSQAAEVGALVLAPVALLFLGNAMSGPFSPWPVVGALVAASLPALLFPLVHSARMRGPAFILFVALIAGADVAVYNAAAERTWPPGDDEVNAIAIDSWDGDRIDPDLLALEHPLVRRWNFWLAKHEFRDRKVALKKAPGVVRIVSLGTSSTYGYRAKEPYGHRLETKLKAQGKDVEVVVAAWPGASGSRLLPFFEHVVLEFEPDILVLSLFHNDAVALSQIDEMAYFERITDADYARSWLDRLRDRLAVRRGASAYETWLNEVTNARGLKEPTTVEGVSPPARWRTMLEGFVRVTSEHGVKLVLVKEPVVDDERLWRRQFFAAMDQVAAAAKVPILDPMPEIQRQGGKRLFMDAVHPYDPGHEVIANALLPGVSVAVDEVLAQRKK